MNLILLTPLDLAMAAGLVVLLAAIDLRLGIGQGRTLLLAALRTTVQLSLVGLVLRFLFAQQGPGWLGVMAMLMLTVAGYEVMSRQRYRFRGGWGYGLGTVSLFISAFTVTPFALLAIIGNQPWYAPQYAIPLLGMLLGNTMNGVALGLERLTSEVHSRRERIEGQLILGYSAEDALAGIKRDSVRAGMVAIINAMAAAGIVSLPGMMTGQILAGTPPLEAVKYQMLIMFLIASGTGFGTLAAVNMASRRLFDARLRLRLERLHAKQE